MTEQDRDRDLAPDDGGRKGGSPGLGDNTETGVGREPWDNRSGAGDTGDMGDTGDANVTPPDTKSGEPEEPAGI